MPCGTTGEAPTLTTDELRRVIEIVVEVADGRVPVLGVGSNNTHTAVANAKTAAEVGAQGVLATVPTTTSRRKKGCIGIFALSQSTPSRSACTTSPDGPHATSRQIRWHGWQRSPTSPV